MAVEPIAEVDHGPDQPRLKLVPPSEAQVEAPPVSDLEKRVTLAFQATIQRIEQARAEAKTQIEAVASRQPSAELLAIFEALAKALSLRLLLFVGFLAMAGAGGYVVYEPTVTRIVAFCLWGVLAYLPVVWLNTRKG